MPDPTDTFETWLLQRVARAVEAGEVSAELLTDLQAEIADARGRPPEERNALAIQELAERANLPVDHLTELLATLEAQPSVTRELVLRRFVEAWLVALEPWGHTSASQTRKISADLYHLDTEETAGSRTTRLQNFSGQLIL